LDFRRRAPRLNSSIAADVKTPLAGFTRRFTGIAAGCKSLTNPDRTASQWRQDLAEDSLTEQSLAASNASEYRQGRIRAVDTVRLEIAAIGCPRRGMA
jgi:hypothetical protein